MSRYHLTILNNETGETLLDTDTSALSGAFVIGDKGGSFSHLDCSLLQACALVKTLEEGHNTLCRENPDLMLGLSLLHRLEDHNNKS